MDVARCWVAFLLISALVVHVVAGVSTIVLARRMAISALVVHAAAAAVVVVVVVVVVVAVAGSVNGIVTSIRRVGRRGRRVCGMTGK